MTTIQNRCKRE